MFWKKRILVIDDEKDFVDMLKCRLQSHGYRVLAAYEGGEGLKLARKKPDLILLDIIMPTISGVEVCQILKTDPKLKQIPVIFLTCKENKEDRLKGLAVGADEYVVKPFYTQDLLQKIRKTLEAKKKK